MLFEKKGSELIGKSAEVLRKQYEQRQIPSDISAWIGFKLTFVVRILANKSADNVDPSFEVIMIKKNHGKQSIVTPIRGPAMALAQSSSSSIAADTDLPPLITIASKKLKTEVYIPHNLIPLYNISFTLTKHLAHLFTFLGNFISNTGFQWDTRHGYLPAQKCVNTPGTQQVGRICLMEQVNPAYSSRGCASQFALQLTRRESLSVI